MRGSRFNRESGDLKTPFLAGKERELLESKKWPACFSQSVDITKVQIEAFKPWITRRVTELMGVEDEIVVDYCISQLKFFGETDAKANTENAGDGGVGLNEKPYLDPKKLQINLTGFMAKNAKIFVKELWDLLIAAQENEYGIPQAFIDEKKREIAEIQKAAREVDDTIREMGTAAEAEGEADDNGASSPRSAVDGDSKRGEEESKEDREPPRRKYSEQPRRASRTRSRSPSYAWYKDNKYHRSRGHRRDDSHYREDSYHRRRYHDRRRRSPTPTPSPSSSSSSRSSSSSPRRYRRDRRSRSYTRKSPARHSSGSGSRSPSKSVHKERSASRDYRRRSPSRSYSRSSRSYNSSSRSYSSSSSSSSYDRRRRRDVRDRRGQRRQRSRDRSRYRRRTRSYSSRSSSRSTRRSRSFSRSYS